MITTEDRKHRETGIQRELQLHMITTERGDRKQRSCRDHREERESGRESWKEYCSSIGLPQREDRKQRGGMDRGDERESGGESKSERASEREMGCGCPLLTAMKSINVRRRVYDL
jgi:hypothetical protein